MCRHKSGKKVQGPRFYPLPAFPTGLNELLKLDPVPLSLGKLPVFMHK